VQLFMKYRRICTEKREVFCGDSCSKEVEKELFGRENAGVNGGKERKGGENCVNNGLWSFVL